MARLLALLLTFFTGASGLVYEVTWQRYLAILVGSHGAATAAVLALFLGGLSAGYALFGEVTRRVVASDTRAERPSRLLLLYGAIELAIGLWAFAFPLLFRGVIALSAWIPHSGGGVGFAFDLVLAGILLLPPTILMGGTIPILTQALSTDLEDATRFHAAVYASNTAGALLGALAAGFVLITWLGLDRVVLAMGAVNVLAGLSFLALGRRAHAAVWTAAPKVEAPAVSSRRGRKERARSSEPAAPARIAGFAYYAAAALLVGFAMMCIQTVLNRLGALSLGASPFTFAMVVAVFVSCIALGSFAVAAFSRVPAWAVVVSQLALLVSLIVLYQLLGESTYDAFLLRTVFRNHQAGFVPFYLMMFEAIFLMLLIPVGLSGAFLPLLFHALRREVADLGALAGRLYSWNTAGSLLGALLGGYLALSWLDLHHVYRLAVLAVALSTVVLAVRLLPRSRAIPVAIAAGLLAILVVEQAAWKPEWLHAGLFRRREPADTGLGGAEAFFKVQQPGLTLAFHDDDPTLSAAVWKSAGGLALATNGKPDTMVPLELPTVVLLGLIPCLLAEHCESAFVVGLGTGSTAGYLAGLEGMQNVVVAEISSAVVAALPLFAEFNQHANENERIEIVQSDAYRALLREKRSFDVIISEPSNPWVTGIENLYAREFLEAAKAKLRPGGVYAQWFHTYETSDDAFALVLRTFASVFPDVAIWNATGGDVLLVGLMDRSRAGDLDRIEQRAAMPSYVKAAADASVPSLSALLVHEGAPPGVLEKVVPAGPLHGLFHPLLTDRAARDFFVGSDISGLALGGPGTGEILERNSLLAKWMARQARPLSEDQRAEMMAEACKLTERACAAFLGLWLHEVPGSERAKAQLAIESGENPLIGGAAEGVRILLSAPSEAPRGDAEHAAKFSDVYASLLYPGVPMRRDTLAEIWNRCTDDPAVCATSRAIVEVDIGPLGSGEGSPANSSSTPVGEAR